MKKLMSILLAVLMLVSIFASCGGNDETTTTEIPTTEATTTEAPTTEIPTTEAPTTEAPTTEAPTTIDPNAPWSSKYDIRDTWSGKTLNVACTTWSKTATAPWSVIELCVEPDKASGFGSKIDIAVLQRQEFIKTTYGVDVDWINAGQYQIGDTLEKATIAENTNYDLALPRALMAQSLVVKGMLYDMGNREFIDFSNTYYNTDSIETFTAKGHTFFIDGDFSKLNKELSYVIFFNKKLLGGQQATADLYDKVRKGKWTWNELVTLCTTVYKDDGDSVYDDDDILGINKTYFGDEIYHYFSIKKVDSDESTGDWELTFNDSKMDEIVGIISSAMESNWTCNRYTGGWNSYSYDYILEKMLFLNSTVREYHTENCKDIGVVPFPMLNEAQGRYYVPTSSQMATLMCIPKSTQDRNMSDYFVDVLSWTGNEYVINAYIEQMSDEFESEVEIEMLVDYIFPNIVYDAEVTVGWSSLFPTTQTHNGIEEFERTYNDDEPDALKTIAEWNAAWGGYTEE